MEPALLDRDRAQEEEWDAARDAAEWADSAWDPEEPASAPSAERLCPIRRARRVIRSSAPPAAPQ